MNQPIKTPYDDEIKHYEEELPHPLSPKLAEILSFRLSQREAYCKGWKAAHASKEAK